MKVCLDAGHYGYYNQSPVNKNYWESKVMWELHLLAKQEAEKRGIEVVTTRTYQNLDSEVSARGKKAKGCDLFLSLHSNATSSASADYAVACCQIADKTTNIDDISIEFGTKLAVAVNSVMGSTGKSTTWRRASNDSDYYGVLRGAKSVGVPAVLIENGFHTNLNNTNWLLNMDNLRKLAVTIVDVICDCFVVEDKPVNEETSDKDYLFRVKVIDDALNVRADAGTQNLIKGVIKDKGTYRITETKTAGNCIWGKLYSGLGWINVDKKYCTKVIE